MWSRKKSVAENAGLKVEKKELAAWRAIREKIVQELESGRRASLINEAILEFLDRKIKEEKEKE